MKRHGLVLASTLLAAACAHNQTPSQAAQSQTSTAQDERVEIPAHQESRETAAAGGATYEPGYHARPTPGNPPGSGTAPGTTKAIAPGQGAFVRTSAPLTTFESEQGKTKADLEITQNVRRAIAADASLTHPVAVTVITHGRHVVLIGEVPSEQEREAIERHATEHADDVASHLELSGE